MYMNPYQILGVEKDASPEEIKNAYRKLAMRYHPDRNPGDPEAEAKFKEASKAYDMLTGQDKNYQDQNIDFDFSDMFSQMFNFGNQRFNSNLNLDIQLEVAIDFWEAVDGCKKIITVPKLTECNNCKGLGATEFQPCIQCAGRGMRSYRQGNMSVNTSCNQCSGSGQKPLKNCDVCSGKGHIQKNEEVEVSFPSGSFDRVILEICLWSSE